MCRNLTKCRYFVEVCRIYHNEVLISEPKTFMVTTLHISIYLLSMLRRTLFVLPIISTD